MCFTHLKAPIDAIAIELPWITSHLGFQNDLFFSGHTAVPFLGFLLFKDSNIRYFFLISSIVLGATVLFMHIHYSIDVFSAFFITFGTFKLGEHVFKKIDERKYGARTLRSE
jgi:cell division protein FtsW (lipid II flippase)